MGIFKKNKIIILTTHSLDEAEYLGDRIGIMSEGHLVCSGTSSYLKNKYPCGYNINLILNPDKFTKENKDNFLNEVKNIYPEYKIKISSKGLLSISCNIIDERTKEIFNYIDNVKNNIGIELNVSEKTKNMDEVKLNEGLEIQNDPQNLHIESSSFKEQLFQNLKRNLIPLTRNKTNFIIEVISSFAILIVYILLFQTYVVNDNSKYKDFSKLLSSNVIYVDKETKDYFEKSFFVKHKNLNIKYELINFETKNLDNKTDTLKSFRDQFFLNNTYHNQKIAITVIKVSFCNIV